MNSPIPSSLHLHRVVPVLGLALFATLATVILVAAHKSDRSRVAVASGHDRATPLAQPVKTRIAERFGKLPLSFEINKGQVDQSVKFWSRGGGYDLFLTASEAVLRVRARRSDKFEGPGRTDTHREENVREGTVLRLKMLGANATPQVEGQGELPGKVNYFFGNDPQKWRREIPTYRSVLFKEIYPGIDVVYYGKQ